MTLLDIPGQSKGAPKDNALGDIFSFALDPGPAPLTPNQTQKLTQTLGVQQGAMSAPAYRSSGTAGGSAYYPGGSSGPKVAPEPTIYDNPEYWKNLSRMNEISKGLYSKQEGFAKKGYGLSAKEVASEKAFLAKQNANMRKLLGMLKEGIYGKWGDLQVGERESAIERSARGSALDYATLTGREIRSTAASRKYAEAAEQERQREQENKQKAALLTIALQKAKLQMTEDLARLSAQRKLAETEYQQQLLNKQYLVMKK